MSKVTASADPIATQAILAAHKELSDMKKTFRLIHESDLNALIHFSPAIRALVRHLFDGRPEPGDPIGRPRMYDPNDPSALLGPV